MAEQKSRTKILDSEIRVENIIPGSPFFIPYHHIKLKVTGKGKGIKNIKIKQENKQDIGSCSTDIARTKHTKTKGEHEKEEEKIHKQKEWAKRATIRAKKSAAAAKATQNPTATKPRKTDNTGGKQPRKQLATKAVQKAAPKKLTKPHTHYAIIAMWEIHRFQKSVDLLIPLLPFQYLIREIAQDFKYDLHFQSGAILAPQEAVEAFLADVWECQLVHHPLGQANHCS